MSDHPSDVTFVDTETLGLHRKAPIWEFAAVRRSYNEPFDGSYTERTFHCFIEHQAQPWLKMMPDQFKVDYLRRFRPAPHVLTKTAAVAMITEAMQGAHIVGAVPNFDTERLHRLIVKHTKMDVEGDVWHYHLIDVENIIVGYLRAAMVHVPSMLHATFQELTTPPWDSNALSSAVGVNPEDYDRHTAMGDVLWARAQYDAVMHNLPTVVNKLQGEPL
jgi:hypothetical protein